METKKDLLIHGLKYLAVFAFAMGLAYVIALYQPPQTRTQQTNPTTEAGYFDTAGKYHE